ncbi:MAG: ATP-dependent zinc protease [Xanthomonadaceae bacterium]|nr:ATP-dependent zinc protease [Xanthomonadaceae bacterium]
MTTKTEPRIWVGWREWVALPELGIDRIKAKIDTGAHTSSIHAIHIRRFREAGRERVAFAVHPLQRRTDLTVACVADVLDERYVTSSSGHRSKRLVVRTLLQIGDQRWPIELTLANRDAMGFRMLLGRTAMKGRLLVDPSASFLVATGATAAPRPTFCAP